MKGGWLTGRESLGHDSTIICMWEITKWTWRFRNQMPPSETFRDGNGVAYEGNKRAWRVEQVRTCDPTTSSSKNTSGSYREDKSSEAVPRRRRRVRWHTLTRNGPWARTSFPSPTSSISEISDPRPSSKRFSWGCLSFNRMNTNGIPIMFTL